MNYLRRASGLWCPDYHLRFPPERGFAQPNYCILPGHFPAGAVAVAVGSSVVAITKTDEDDTFTATTTSHTWTGIGIGAAASDRKVVVALSTEPGNDPFSFSTFTIGGVAATLLVQALSSGGGSRNLSCLYIADVPSGTSADIDVQGTANLNGAGITVFRMTGAGTLADSDFDEPAGSGTTLLSTVTIPANGGAIAAAGARRHHTFSWSGADEKSDFQVNNSQDLTCSTASRVTASELSNHSVNATVSSASGRRTLAIAAWNPA